ncbi:MAG: flagellar basal body-associated FliL family protein [Pseudomonadota bacterium]|nr:flagellar basal body-associated FliL family protein [Pseudomonadota bacterium]
MILPVLLAQPSSPEDSKVNLDRGGLREDIPKGLQKVELDLDDALFLEFEDKEETAPQSLPAPQEEETVQPVARPFWKNSRVLVAASVLLLVGVGSVAFFLPSPEEPVPQPAAPIPPPPRPEQEFPVSLQPRGFPDPLPDLPAPVFAFDSFQVEHSQAGQVRLLTCRFGVPEANQTLTLEMREKNIILRDGVYRYLRNKPLAFLSNPANSDKIKADIVAVLNQSLQSGQVSSILFEEYAVQ